MRNQPASFIHLFLPVLLVFMFISSCKKNVRSEIKFPAETQTGANSFGCYINGVAFIPSTTLYGNVRPVHAYYTPQSNPYYQAGFLSLQGIDARYYLDIAGDLLIQKLAVFGTGDYDLAHINNCPQPYDCDAGDYHNAKESRYYFIESGRLTVTRLDTAEKIISGRFYMTVRDTTGNRQQVTDGVFDARYRN